MFKVSINKKVVVFGFIFTFFSSFGQSFFLGLFNAPIRDELGISHGQFGNIYASATIFSSLLLIWVGKKIDEFHIIYYSFFVILLLFLSSLLFSFINNIYFLALGIFLMRFAGQGLMSHTATTTISRFFNQTRGKCPQCNLVWSFICRIYSTYFCNIFIFDLFLANSLARYSNFNYIILTPNNFQYD